MELRLEIEKLVSKGDGLARHEGKTIFVTGALRGETVLAETIEDKGDYSRAEVVEIVTASPDRVVPACPHYGVCGGCDMQHATTEAQAVQKSLIVQENLLRIGGIDIDSEAEGITTYPVASAQGWGYRTRVKFHVDLEQKKAGFLGRKSNDLVDIRHCPILCNSLNRLLDEKRPLLFRAAQMRQKSEIWQKRNALIEVPAFAGDTKVSLSTQEVAVEVAGKTLWADSNVFFQANRQVLPAMVDFVKNHVEGKTIVDLYAGVGTFAAFLEGPDRQVVAVERDKRCLQLAEKNLSHTEFFPQTAEHWVRMQKDRQVDTVIVDPPRTGLDAKVIGAICSWKPLSVVYVSCDSVTLARDCKKFAEKGFKVKALQVFDLYPQTSHVEAAVLISRVDS